MLTRPGSMRPIRPPDITQAGKTLIASPFAASQICSQYSHLQKEVAFAKLVDVTRAAADELSDRIREIERQVQQLKEMAEKIDKVSSVIKQLLPAILEAVGADQGSDCMPSLANVTLHAVRLDRLAARWEQELVVAGVHLDPNKLKSITVATTNGGSAAADPVSSLAALIADVRRAAQQATVLFSIPGLK